MTDYIKEAKANVHSYGIAGGHQDEAIGDALIAIAEQLRIANLLELSSDDDSYCTELASRKLFDDDNYTSDIAEALGIKEES